MEAERPTLRNLRCAHGTTARLDTIIAWRQYHRRVVRHLHRRLVRGARPIAVHTHSIVRGSTRRVLRRQALNGRTWLACFGSRCTILANLALLAICPVCAGREGAGRASQAPVAGLRLRHVVARPAVAPFGHQYRLGARPQARHVVAPTPPTPAACTAIWGQWTIVLLIVGHVGKRAAS